MLNILSLDLLIADNNIPLPYRTKSQIAERVAANPALAGKFKDVDMLDEPQRSQYKKVRALLDSWLPRNADGSRQDKLAADKSRFIELSDAKAGLPNDGWTPGGSSANTLYTVSRLMGPEQVHIDFMGIAGKSEYSQMIRQSLKSANINIFPDPPPLAPGQTPESAVSFVFNDPEGKTTITYGGNARDILKPEMVTPQMFEGRTHLFLQGALWDKFRRKHKGDMSVPDMLVHHRWEEERRGHEIMMLYACPTQKTFSGFTSEEDHVFINASADVTLSNATELARIYKASCRDEALEKLQKTLNERDHNRHRHGLRERNYAATGFITDDANPVALVTPTDIIFVPVIPLRDGEPSYMVGAGDNAFAGNIVASAAGLPLEQCGQFANEVASAKLKFNSARIPDPRDAIMNGTFHGEEFMPPSKRGRELMLKIEANLKRQELRDFGYNL